MNIFFLNATETLKWLPKWTH